MLEFEFRSLYSHKVLQVMDVRPNRINLNIGTRKRINNSLLKMIDHLRKEKSNEENEIGIASYFPLHHKHQEIGFIDNNRLIGV